LPSGVEPLFLWGAPGVGKTTIGRRLAAALERPFIDTDQVAVERAGMSIAQMFAVWGEPAFRALESDVLAAAVETSAAVIALGGGTVLAPANRELMAARGRTIHLRASVATLERRLRGGRTNRPLIAAGIPVATLLAQRLPLYAAADHTIDVDRRTPDDIVAEIRALL
jgi:shikimate kinase